MVNIHLNDRTQGLGYNVNITQASSRYCIPWFEQFLRPFLRPRTHNPVPNVYERLSRQLQHQVIECRSIRNFSLQNNLSLTLKKEDNSLILARGV